MESSPSLRVTPYVFVETSNLLGKALAASHLEVSRGILGRLALEHEECTSSLTELAKSKMFSINGVTDAALFEMSKSQSTALLTVDAKLYAYTVERAFMPVTLPNPYCGARGNVGRLDLQHPLFLIQIKAATMGAVIKH